MFDEQFIKDFSELGRILLKWIKGERVIDSLDCAIELSAKKNPFFTPFMVKKSIEVLCANFLQPDALLMLLNRGDFNHTPYKIGLIAAGNIPLVLFQDFICVISTNNIAIIKLSSKDNCLFPEIVNLLYGINPAWQKKIIITERLDPYEVDKIITMGSDSTATAVKNKYSGIQSLVRSSKFSFGVLTGNEEQKNLSALGEDMFLYFGLGCRSISTLMVPQNYDFKPLIEATAPLRTIVDIDAYKNAYLREKAIAIMENEEFIDGGFFLFLNRDPLHVPLGVVNIFKYDSCTDIAQFENKFASHIQKKYCTFGLAQRPNLFDWPDGKDILKFLSKAKLRDDL